MERLEQARRLGHASEEAHARPLGCPLGRGQEQHVGSLHLTGDLFLQPDLACGSEHLAQDADEEQLQQIRALLPAARKLLELLEENAARLDDRIQRRVKGLAAIVEIRGQDLDDRELLGRYEKTIAYRSAPQVKGARTRRRNRAEVAAQGSGDATE